MKERRIIQTLTDLLEPPCSPDIPAATVKKRKQYTTVAYCDFKADILSHAARFSDQDWGGKHIALIGSSGYGWIVRFFTILVKGGTAVLIDNKLPEEEIVSMIDRSHAAFLLIHANHKSLPISNIPYEYYNDDPFVADPDKNDAPLAENLPPAAPETPAVIAFTSGTTGQSKMVRLTHKNICSNIMGLDDHFKERLSPGMSVLPLIPFFHMYGLTAGVLIPLYYGMTVNYLDSLKYASAAMKMMNPDVLAIVPVILESIARRIIAAASGNPALIPPVIKKMFSKKTRLIICGGASLCDDIYKMFSTAGIEVCTGYGMTECSPVLACNPPGAPRIGSVGTALISDFEEIKIVDNEIMVRGEFVMDAYYEDEEETEKIFRDGWLATGDLGYFDEDGYLYITGRKKNLIILSDGNNIAPEELENKIGTNPLVGSVMVHTDPDDRYNRLIASIYPDWEYINEHSIPDFKDKVKNAVLRINSELPPYKRISKTKFVRKDFEKNRLGKIKRFAVSGKLDK